MYTSRFFKSLFLVLTLAFTWSNLSAGNGELIVFTDASETVVNKDFIANWLPKVKEMAKEQGFKVIQKDVSKGFPEEVTSTPAIFFQNHLGRSAYIGRYQYINKIKTFIRTVSRMPQKGAVNEKHDVLVWQHGRATVYSPLKITDLAGAVPPGFDQAKFKKEAMTALDEGASNYGFQSLYEANRNDRAMYWALYPYLGEDGKLFISAEVYSQFSCIEPVYKRFENAYTGSWSAWKSAFQEVGSSMEKVIAEKLLSTEKGDGMIPVLNKAKAKSWESLGLKLPKAPKGTDAKIVTDIKLPSEWEFAGEIGDGTPVVGFSFLAPMDYYAGEITKLFGEMRLSNGLDINSALGKFGVETKTLTMGDPGLDEHVHEMIEIIDNPKAYFTFQKMLSAESPVLAFGTLTQFKVSGELEFMAVKAPLEVTAQIEPILDEAGQPRLQVMASFSLRLKEKYNLDGPDGPAPASDTMQFLLNFLLKPSEK